ncbi:hypothetical protein CDAR_508471 [Caerostris darwini]|uniref:Uncharacterized protein n=1 Tax=Caerostris darwini TaxID=1538125 RepID=A0AAV4N202_9ARAC|nr:hypothetical protein CDAR_508471 [Caerostris darwini]
MKFNYEKVECNCAVFSFYVKRGKRGDKEKNNSERPTVFCYTEVRYISDSRGEKRCHLPGELSGFYSTFASSVREKLVKPQQETRISLYNSSQNCLRVRSHTSEESNPRSSARIIVGPRVVAKTTFE